MEILHKDDSTKGMFYVEHDNIVLAEMHYVWVGTDRIIIEHTSVNEVFKGRGVGKQMVAKAVAFTREKGVKIIPLCSFARSVFDKEDEFNDVL